MTYKQFINEFGFPNTTKEGEKLLQKQGRIAKYPKVKKYKNIKAGSGKAYDVPEK